MEFWPPASANASMMNGSAAAVAQAAASLPTRLTPAGLAGMGGASG
jgi:hypothetical protein